MFMLSTEIAVNFIGLQQLPAAIWLYGWEMIDNPDRCWYDIYTLIKPKDALTIKIVLNFKPHPYFLKALPSLTLAFRAYYFNLSWLLYFHVGNRAYTEKGKFQI